jgi:ADP-ribosylglycohydrolase
VNEALLRSKVQGCLVGFYIGDALAMPVHWYYDLRQLVSDYGKSGITKFEAPKVLFK